MQRCVFMFWRPVAPSKPGFPAPARPCFGLKSRVGFWCTAQCFSVISDLSFYELVLGAPLQGAHKNYLYTDASLWFSLPLVQTYSFNVPKLDLHCANMCLFILFFISKELYTTISCQRENLHRVLTIQNCPSQSVFCELLCVVCVLRIQ